MNEIKRRYFQQHVAPFIHDFADQMNRIVLPQIQKLAKIFENLSAKLYWQRRFGETDDQWAQRLAADNWLDNPDARWQYQKLIWSTPLRILRRWFNAKT